MNKIEYMQKISEIKKAIDQLEEAIEQGKQDLALRFGIKLSVTQAELLNEIHHEFNSEDRNKDEGKDTSEFE